MFIFALEKYSMERIEKHSLKIKDPAEGYAAFDFHWILSANLKQGFSVLPP